MQPRVIEDDYGGPQGSVLSYLLKRACFLLRWIKTGTDHRHLLHRFGDRFCSCFRLRPPLQIQENQRDPPTSVHDPSGENPLRFSNIKLDISLFSSYDPDLWSLYLFFFFTHNNRTETVN